MKKILEKKLKILTKLALKKQKPMLITITGSVGKTSTKEAVYAVLKTKFSARRGVKNYNNEIGVPLTVLGVDWPGKNIFSWLKLFFTFKKLILFKSKAYPDVLVLEIAADKPGDLKYLMEMFPPELVKASVLTAVTPVHLEFFGDLQAVFKEKITPFFYLAENGVAIINKDNCDFEKIRAKVQKKLITYSINKPAEVTAENFRVEDRGLAFQIKYQSGLSDFLLEGGVSPHQTYALLAGVCVGVALGMGLEEIIDGLQNYSILPGRMRKIKGISNSVLIDDTYNSSPEAAKRALEALSDLPFGKRKIAVLGDMLEMGKQSEELHRQVGKLAAGLKIDQLFTFGEQAEFILDEAVRSGFSPANGRKFAEQTELVAFLEGLIQPDDVILVKGSQGMRLEKVVKALMAHPEKAQDLLVRQTSDWLKR